MRAQPAPRHASAYHPRPAARRPVPRGGLTPRRARPCRSFGTTCLSRRVTAKAEAPGSPPAKAPMLSLPLVCRLPSLVAWSRRPRLARRRALERAAARWRTPRREGKTAWRCARRTTAWRSPSAKAPKLSLPQNRRLPPLVVWSRRLCSARRKVLEHVARHCASSGSDLRRPLCPSVCLAPRSKWRRQQPATLGAQVRPCRRRGPSDEGGASAAAAPSAGLPIQHTPGQHGGVGAPGSRPLVRPRVVWWCGSPCDCPWARRRGGRCAGGVRGFWRHASSLPTRMRARRLPAVPLDELACVAEHSTGNQRVDGGQPVGGDVSV